LHYVSVFQIETFYLHLNYRFIYLCIVYFAVILTSGDVAFAESLDGGRQEGDRVEEEEYTVLCESVLQVCVERHGGEGHHRRPGERE
jgi:hypothetical protein